MEIMDWVTIAPILLVYLINSLVPTSKENEIKPKQIKTAPIARFSRIPNQKNRLAQLQTSKNFLNALSLCTDIYPDGKSSFDETHMQTAQTILSTLWKEISNEEKSHFTQYLPGISDLMEKKMGPTQQTIFSNLLVKKIKETELLLKEDKNNKNLISNEITHLNPYAQDLHYLQALHTLQHINNLNSKIVSKL